MSGALEKNYLKGLCCKLIMLKTTICQIKPGNYRETFQNKYRARSIKEAKISNRDFGVETDESKLGFVLPEVTLSYLCLGQTEQLPHQTVHSS